MSEETTTDSESRARFFDLSTPNETTAIRVCEINSPLGPLIGGATEEGICLLEFIDRSAFHAQLEALRRRFNCALSGDDSDHLDCLRTELAQYFAGERREFSVALDVRGSDWQKRVWQQLREIEYGTTISYQELAARVGSVGAARAVGAANGRNGITIVIPCHRVIAKNGALQGYIGTLWRKKWLLDLESSGGQLALWP